MDKQTVDVIFEGLRSHDLPLRVDSFSKIHFLAEAIGPQKTREELLPYLQEFADDEDAILLEILNQLSSILNHIGGPQYLHYTFDILQSFMLHDDSTVRLRAVDVFVSYLPLLDPTQVVRYVLPVVRHMVLSEWYVGRLSVTTILPHVYPLCSTHLQNELCSIFSALALDEHPAVRRLTCQQFGLFATFCLNDSRLARMLYHLLIHTSKDVQDSVRMAAVDSCIIVSDVLRHYNAQHKALTIIFSLTTDISWRVRYVVARRFPLILASLDMSSFTGDEGAEYFAKLLTDHESEVRTAAASVLGRVCCLLGSDKTLRYLVPLFKLCAEDVHDSVRIALSRDLLYTCNTLPQYIVNETILPLFQQLLTDSRSEVKLNLMSNIDLLKPHVTEDSLFKTLLPSIIELSQHHQWRIRVNITSQYVILAKQLSQDTFVQRILPIAMCQLCDPVASVRYGAISNFFKFTVVYGVEWCKTNLLPRLQILSEHQSFTHRLSAALALTGLLQILPLTIIQESIYPILHALLTDRVTNIQLMALRSIALILSRLLQFSPHEHVWLQEDQLFTFTDDQQTTTSNISTISPSDSSLVLHILLHNIKQRIFWEQIQEMLPAASNNKILLDSPPQIAAPVPSTPVKGQQSAVSNAIPSAPRFYTLNPDATNKAEHQLVQVPTMASYLNPSNPTHARIFKDVQQDKEYHSYIDPTESLDIYSNLITLLKSPDFATSSPETLIYQPHSANSSTTDCKTTVNAKQTVPQSLFEANVTNEPTFSVNSALAANTINDTSLSLREYMNIIQLYLKKIHTQNSVLKATLDNDIIDLDTKSTPPQSQNQPASEPSSSQSSQPSQLQNNKSQLARTLPFHLLSILSPNSTPGQNGSSSSSSQSSSAPRYGAELYIFLLLKRLREDYRRIIRENINAILTKLTNTTGSANISGSPEESDLPQDDESTLLSELNQLKSLLTEQYQQDVRQDKYLFHTTPVIYQLQHQKHQLLAEIVQQDDKLRNTPAMTTFRAQLLSDLDRFRHQRTRGSTELAVFANETYRLIAQLSSPVLQEIDV